ncbi:MAG: aminomethyl-transferring glycine dehydrogenase subunit GcvPB [Methylacidiphilales bacterium]|nr:aminomethyl-transferring glycine dehydrogenase subunit GcvPB [Candidatus Methylacidiphilales bacterium]
MLIFEQSTQHRANHHLYPHECDQLSTNIPQSLQRMNPPGLPEVSELEVVRHYTKLSQKNFSITTQIYPLGSCTMKYNPWACHQLAMLPNFLQVHPLAPDSHMQGTLQVMFELQEMLASLSGMAGCSLSPMAGAQGELAGLLMIKKYLKQKKLHHKNIVLVPQSAHGTNPATARMCGFEIVEIASDSRGNVDLDNLKRNINDATAAIMLTNPSTYGLYEEHISTIATCIHEVQGLLYYDGANLNALLGKVRPGDIGFDVMHTNLHKTFATPHGGGGPGSGAVLCSKRLLPYLPAPRVYKDKQKYRISNEKEFSQSIGRLSGGIGNVGVLLRAYSYIRLLGKQGASRVAEFAVLNANYLLRQLEKAGYSPAFPNRNAGHEFIITLAPELKQHGITALHIAKNLLDYDIHPPTTYFPLQIPECLLFEPTETESKQALDSVIAALIDIRRRISSEPEKLKSAPHTQRLNRLDDTRASHPKHLCLRHQNKN